MVPIAWRILWNERTRLLITVSAIGAVVMLLLFLSGIYEGVRQGAISYIARSSATIWACQKNANNLLRSSSFIDSRRTADVASVEGVRSVTGILRLMTSASIAGETVSFVLYGVDPASPSAMPQTIEQGSGALHAGGIVIDESFARKHRLSPGDTITIRDRPFLITGLSGETNAIVAQFAFATIGDVQAVLGYPGIVSFLLVTVDTSRGPLSPETLQARFPELEFFEKETFLRNNLTEMNKGILPVLWTISFLGALVGMSMITLVLYGAIIERREEYAVLKAIGSSQGFLDRLVVRQSILSCAIGTAAGIGLYFCCAPPLQACVPELALRTTAPDVAMVALGAFLFSVAGALLPVRKLRNVYPAEVFRA